MFGKKEITLFEIGKEEELNEALKSKGITIVDFYSYDCPTCKVIEPKFKDLSKLYKNGKFLKVNIDEINVGRRYSITTVPSIQFFYNGEKFDEVSGSKPNDLSNKVQAALA